MYPISPLYADYLRRLDREFIVKATVQGEDYDSSKIVDFSIENSLSLSSGFEIGNAIPSKLIIKLRTNEIIPANARIVPYLSLTTAGLTWLEATYPWLDTHVPWTGTGTDWMPLGEFFVDSREKVNDVWTFTCYDKLVFADDIYVSSLTYPATMQAVWNEMMQRLGWTNDGSVAINSSYVIQVGPAGFTYRQMMAYIASANSASVFIGKDGTVKFKRFTAAAVPVFEMTASDYSRVKQTNPVKTFTRVVVTYNTEDDLSYEAGSGDSNHTLQLINPFATQAIVNDLLATLNGFAYLPVVIEGIGYPQLEHGDVIGFERYEGSSWLETVSTWSGTDIPWNGIVDYQTLIMHQVFTFSGGLRMTIEAPSQSEQQSEFPARGTIKEAINNLNKTALKEGRDYYGFSASREFGLIVEREDHKSKLTLNSDKMDWQVNGQSALHYDAQANRLKFTGTLEGVDGVFSGSLSGGSIEIGSGNAVFKANTSGIWSGNSDFGNAPFRVDMAGALVTNKLTANSAEIRDSSFTGGQITGSSINVGNSVFTVNGNGHMRATSGEFSGAIMASTISGGTITGALIRTADSGQRIEVTPTGLRSYDASGVKRVSIANDGRGNYGGVGFWGSGGSELAGMYTEDNFSFLYAVGALQIFSFSDRVFFSSNVDFTTATAYGLKISSVIDLQDTLDTKATNMTFDPTSRNLKLWNSNGGLLAQVNIPK